jgi:PAS domain S-box-containing protein
MPRKNLLTADCRLARIILPVFAAAAAALLGLRLPGHESPFYLFLAASTLIAVYVGLVPALVSIALSLLLVRVIFFSPASIFIWPGELHVEQLIQMTSFGLVTATVCCLAAASRRERHTQQLRAEQCKAIADTAPDAMILFDQRGLIAAVNRRAEQVFETTADEMIGKKINQFLPDQTCEISRTHCGGSLDTRVENVPISALALRRSGEALSIEFTLNSVQGANCTAAWIRTRQNERNNESIGSEHRQLNRALVPRRPMSV